MGWSIDAPVRPPAPQERFSYGYEVAMPEKLIEVASETGMSSLAFTDKDGLYDGIPRFLKPVDGGGGSDRRTWARA